MELGDLGTKMNFCPSRVEIIITEAQTPHETENVWEKMEAFQQQQEEEEAAARNRVESLSSEELDEARKEAQQLVSEVISKATQLVQNGSVVHVQQVDEEKERKEKMKEDPELLDKAREFVQALLEKAVEEANRRSQTRKLSKQKSESVVELQEEIDAEAAPSHGIKRKPWYRRAHSSLCHFFQRICACVCGRHHR